jgi:hypothetical protein
LYGRSNCFPNILITGTNRMVQYSGAILDDVWVQDYMELGKCQVNTAGMLDHVIDLQHPHVGTFIANFVSQEKLNGGADWWSNTWTNWGNGGNIEVFPPYTNDVGTVYPLGRAVMGSDCTNEVRMGSDTNTFGRIVAQKIQDPILLTLDWLAVGHVDEVFSFLDANNVLLADPAFAIMQIQLIACYPGTSDLQIRVGTNWNNTLSNNAIQTVTNAPNFFFDQRSTLQASVTSNDTMFVISSGTYQAGDYLHIDGENVRVASNNLLNVFVERAQLWGAALPIPHSAGVPVFKWSTNMVRNAFAGGNSLYQSSFYFKTCDTLANELKSKLGKAVNFIHVPVVFDYSYWTVVGRWAYLAATANMVNGVQDGTTFHVTDPGNQHFRTLVSVPLQQLTPQYTVNFVADTNAWDVYHCNQGELHCGSNAKRTFQFDKPWWQQNSYTNWPNR